MTAELQGNLPKAEELYQQSIVFRREVKDRRGEGNVLNNLGQVFAQSGDTAKAIKYLDQSLDVRLDEPKPEPKVSIRASVKPDYIVCLEDAKRLKMLKRHLMTHYNMTPDQYRQKWGLSADYPMVAPNYAEQRRALAKKIGLGTKRKRTAAKK